MNVKTDMALIFILRLLAVIQLLKEGNALLMDMEPFLLPIVLVYVGLNFVLWRPRPDGFYLIITVVAYQFLNYLYWFVSSTFLLPIIAYSQMSKLFWGIMTLFYALLLGWTLWAKNGLGYSKEISHLKRVGVVLATLVILMFSNSLTMDSLGLSGDEIITFPRQNIYHSALTPDGNYLVMHLRDVADKEKTIVWDVRTRQTVKTLFEKPMFRMRMSPDGTYVGITDNYHGDVGAMVWNMHSGSLIKTIKMNRLKWESISSISFSADSKQIGYGTKEGVRIEDLHGKGVISIEVPKSDLNAGPKANQNNFAVCYSPDNEHIALARYQEISIWSTKTKERSAVLKSELSFISPHGHNEFSKDGSYLAVEGVPYESDRVGREGIEIWDMKKKKSIGVYSVDSQINAVAFSPDGNYLAIGSQTRKITLVDVFQNKQTRLFGTHPFPAVEFLAFSPDGKLLYSGGGSALKVWHLK